MTVAGLRQDDFISILAANGYVVLSKDYWDLEGVNRIVLGKDGHTFAFRLRKFVFYPEVVYKFTSLNITNIPQNLMDDYAACVKAYAQDMEMRKDLTREKDKNKGNEGK